MQGSTLQARTKRAVIVLAIIGACFVAGQYMTYLFTAGSDPAERCDTVTTHKTFSDVETMTNSKFYREAYYADTIEGIRGKAGDGDLHGPLTVTTTVQPQECGWLFNFKAATIERVLGYLIGTCVLIAAAMVLYLLYELSRWIWFGRRPSVDPCRDPECPCQRHVVERERAERAQAIAMGAAVGAVIVSASCGGS